MLHWWWRRIVFFTNLPVQQILTGIAMASGGKRSIGQKSLESLDSLAAIDSTYFSTSKWLGYLINWREYS